MALKSQRSEAIEREEALQVAHCNVHACIRMLKDVAARLYQLLILLSVAHSRTQSQLKGVWSWADKERKALVRQVCELGHARFVGCAQASELVYLHAHS